MGEKHVSAVAQGWGWSHVSLQGTRPTHSIFLRLLSIPINLRRNDCAFKWFVWLAALLSYLNPLGLRGPLRVSPEPKHNNTALVFFNKFISCYSLRANTLLHPQ